MNVLVLPPSAPCSSRVPSKLTLVVLETFHRVPARQVRLPASETVNPVYGVISPSPRRARSP